MARKAFVYGPQISWKVRRVLYGPLGVSRGACVDDPELVLNRGEAIQFLRR
jgi:hypothetical protein